ncbi:MAG: hypothetical protein QXX81_00660 [Zestosphaera sp.]
MVVVRLHGLLREEAGTTVLNVRGCNLEEVLQNLPPEVGEVLRMYAKHLIILADGRRIYDMKTILDEDATVDITLPVGGG